MGKEIEIDYTFDGCQDLVGYVIKGRYSKPYYSPIVFDSIDDAYDAAIQELAR